MDNEATKILLVEDNPGDARLIREMLAGPESKGFSIEWVSKLSEGLERLSQGEIDLVLLDLALPDSIGLNTFLQAYTRAPDVPFVLLTGLDDETMALTAVRKGAQDYLIKGHVNGELLRRAIRYATERKRVEEVLRLNEERFRLTFDQSPIGAAIVSLDHHYLRVNEKLCSTTGYLENELTAMGFPDITHPDDLPVIFAKAQELIDGNIDQFQMEKRNIRKDGKIIWINLSVRLMKDAHGRPLYFLPMMEDITERKQAEEELTRYRDHLENLVEERTADLSKTNIKLREEVKERKRVAEALKKSTEKIKLFAYSVSHDLKNPAIGIYGLTNLLLKHYKERLDDRGKNYCNQILRASEQIATLVENINVYISTKEIPLKLKRLNLNELLQIIREEFSPQLNIRQIKLSYPEHIPDIRADKLSILRVVRNLVDNALKYGGDKLSAIRIGYEDIGKDMVIYISNDGVPIKIEETEKIFELFQRYDNSEGVEGSGLGLAIVKEIAERHGGKVWVESNPEKGTTFSFSIPK